ncbi:MAG: hypothetical protein JSS50_00685 [Proteobacteria bacterium]|nr:hypothetical protein [Pseudomonadota bacterium]
MKYIERLFEKTPSRALDRGVSPGYDELAKNCKEAKQRNDAARGNLWTGMNTYLDVTMEEMAKRSQQIEKTDGFKKAGRHAVGLTNDQDATVPFGQAFVTNLMGLEVSSGKISAIKPDNGGALTFASIVKAEQYNEIRVQYDADFQAKVQEFAVQNGLKADDGHSKILKRVNKHLQAVMLGNYVELKAGMADVVDTTKLTTAHTVAKQIDANKPALAGVQTEVAQATKLAKTANEQTPNGSDDKTTEAKKTATDALAKWYKIARDIGVTEEQIDAANVSGIQDHSKFSEATEAKVNAHTALDKTNRASNFIYELAILQQQAAVKVASQIAKEGQVHFNHNGKKDTQQLQPNSKTALANLVTSQKATLAMLETGRVAMKEGKPQQQKLAMQVLVGVGIAFGEMLAGGALGGGLAAGGFYAASPIYNQFVDPTQAIDPMITNEHWTQAANALNDMVHGSFDQVKDALLTQHNPALIILISCAGLGLLSLIPAVVTTVHETRERYSGGKETKEGIENVLASEVKNKIGELVTAAKSKQRDVA